MEMARCGGGGDGGGCCSERLTSYDILNFGCGPTLKRCSEWMLKQLPLGKGVKPEYIFFMPNFQKKLPHSVSCVREADLAFVYLIDQAEWSSAQLLIQIFDGVSN